jgi:hypothetical protein
MQALFLFRKYEELVRIGLFEKVVEWLYDVGRATSWEVPPKHMPHDLKRPDIE